MKTRAVNALAFAGLTAWAAGAHARLVPGLACMAAGQACLLLSIVGDWRGRKGLELAWAFLAFSYFGGAFLFAAFFGSPAAGRFWIAFAAVAVVASPIVLLARVVFLRR